MWVNIRQMLFAGLVTAQCCWASVVRRTYEEGAEVLPSPSSQQSEGYGNCQFTHDCRRDENQHCKSIQDASCICNQGTCIIRGHVWWQPEPRQTECKTLQDCKNSGKCNGVPDSQCFCIDEQCETGTQWECHETSDCAKMDKCTGKDCTCEDGTCEWNCFTDDDCNNGPFYCDPLGYHCKCQNSKCDLVKLPTQCKESSGDGLRECVEKNFCKKDEPCQCLQDFCTKPWYVQEKVAVSGGTRDLNCQTTQAWARAGMCVKNPMLMTHTCRESCGVCGFLAPSDATEQVVGQFSYSHFWSNNFDCGRYKNLNEVTAKPVNKGRKGGRGRRAAANNKDEIWSFSFAGAASSGEAYCGATLITDRWVLTAAHCHDHVDNEKPPEEKFGPRKVKINTIRDNTPYREIVEVKRVVMHPHYKFPSQYDDIALLELGRRIEYNWDVYGDSPVCMDAGREDLVGREATVQGYGENELGSRGVLMEGKVQVVSNEECQKMLDHNATDNHIAKRQLKKTLPKGINDQLLCSQGILNEETGVVSGPCKGDDGGPLNVKMGGRTTIAGIVAGGIGCGKGYPSWYTRLSFYADWVECVIGKSRTKSRAWVERECGKVAKLGKASNKL